jgi:hypothetical protein
VPDTNNAAVTVAVKVTVWLMSEGLAVEVTTLVVAEVVQSRRLIDNCIVTSSPAPIERITPIFVDDIKLPAKAGLSVRNKFCTGPHPAVPDEAEKVSNGLSAVQCPLLACCTTKVPPEPDVSVAEEFTGTRA